MSIKFIDSLPSARRGGHESLDPIREALIARPGQWAEVRRVEGERSPVVGGVAGALKREPKRFPGWSFEAVARQDGPDAVVYARAVKA